MSLTCRNIRQLHDAFADGELSPSLTAEFHAHLLQCPACQRQIEMLRAVGDVISGDRPEPELDSGFAQRVIATMPKAALLPQAAPPPRLAWRVLRRASLPAAAAGLFLAIVLWPKEQSDKQTRVAGFSAMKAVVDPTLDVVADTRKAAQSLNQLLTISADQAREDVQQGVDLLRNRAARPVTFSDILWIPFDEVLRSPAPPPADNAGEPETVRF
jgi:hypothetical protein